MSKFQYLRIHQPTDEFLAQLGADGWELVAVATQLSSRPFYSDSSHPSIQGSLLYIFKREAT